MFVSKRRAVLLPVATDGSKEIGLEETNATCKREKLPPHPPCTF